MILLYTGAEKPNFPQKSPDLSLGGWVSSTTIPNNFLNNLFSRMSKQDLIDKEYQVRCIALKNIASSAITDLALYTITPETSLSTLKFALVQANLDPTCNAPYFESIMNGQSMPYYADFQSYEGVDNAFALSTIAAGEVVGIWMLREVSQVGIDSVANQTCTEIAAEFTNPSTPPPTEDVLQFIIDF